MPGPPEGGQPPEQRLDPGGAGQVEVHVELAGLCARAADVRSGAWMGFAPGRGRAAPSDGLLGWVSCWLWAGPFTLGAVWPPRFLPPLPFHPLSLPCACQASRVGHSSPALSFLSPGLALRGAVSGQGGFSPLPGSISPISNVTVRLRAPSQGTRSLQDLSPSFSRSRSDWS